MTSELVYNIFGDGTVGDIGDKEGIIQGIYVHLSDPGKSLVVTVPCEPPAPARQLVIP